MTACAALDEAAEGAAKQLLGPIRCAPFTLHHAHLTLHSASCTLHLPLTINTQTTDSLLVALHCLFLFVLFPLLTDDALTPTFLILALASASRVAPVAAAGSHSLLPSSLQTTHRPCQPFSSAHTILLPLSPAGLGQLCRRPARLHAPQPGCGQAASQAARHAAAAAASWG